MLGKIEYWVILLKKEHNSRIIIAKHKINAITKTLKALGREFLIGSHAPTYISGTKRFYFIDVESGTQLNLDGVAPLLTPEELDLIIGQKLIREITSGVNSMNKDKLMSAILGFVFGILLMGMVLTMYYSDKMAQITGNIIPFQ